MQLNTIITLLKSDQDELCPLEAHQDGAQFVPRALRLDESDQKTRTDANLRSVYPSRRQSRYLNLGGRSQELQESELPVVQDSGGSSVSQVDSDVVLKPF